MKRVSKTGRPRRGKKPMGNRRIVVPVTQEEHRAFSQKAKQAGLPVAEFVRRLALGASSSRSDAIAS